MKNLKVSLIPGDGIGPEVVYEGIKVFQEKVSQTI